MSSLLRQAPSIDHVGTAALGCPAERSSACYSGNRIQTTAGHRIPETKRTICLPQSNRLPKLKMLTHGNLAAQLKAQLRSLCAGAVLASGHPISVFAPARAAPFFRRGESRLQCTRKGVSRMLPLDATVLIS